MSKLTADDTVLGLAAAVTDRTCELITEGWTKGKMRSGAGGVQSFCIHGALHLAMEETFGVRDPRQDIQKDVEQVAVAFICDEAFGSMKRATGGIPAAAFNDASQRKHQEVIDVLERATKRLWGVTFDTVETEQPFEYSQWANVDEAQAQQYLYASLAN